MKRDYMEITLDPEYPFFSYEHTPRSNEDMLHWHDDLEVGLCLEGQGKFIFSDKVYEVSKGDIFIVNNFEHHIAVSDLKNPAKYLFIFFLPQLIANPGSSTFDFEYLSPFWYDPKSFCNKIDYSEEVAGYIAQTLKQILEDWQNKGPAYKHLIAASVRKVLALLVRHYKTTESDFFASHLANQKRVQPVLDYIRKNYKCNLTLEEVSDILHMSPSRFRHYFKDITNFNFKEYIFYLRISEAKRMLSEIDISISDIAYNVGFSNLNQFYMLFNKYVLTSPAKYRSSARGLDILPVSTHPEPFAGFYDK